MRRRPPRQLRLFQSFLLDLYELQDLTPVKNKDGLVVMMPPVLDNVYDTRADVEFSYQLFQQGTRRSPDAPPEQQLREVINLCTYASSNGMNCVYPIGRDMVLLSDQGFTEKHLLDVGLEILKTDAECGDPDSGNFLYNWYAKDAPEAERSPVKAQKYLLMAGQNFSAPAAFELGMYTNGHANPALPPLRKGPDANRALYWLNKMFDDQSTGYVPEEAEQTALNEMMGIVTAPNVRLSPSMRRKAENLLFAPVNG